MCGFEVPGFIDAHKRRLTDPSMGHTGNHHLGMRLNIRGFISQDNYGTIPTPTPNKWGFNMTINHCLLGHRWTLPSQCLGSSWRNLVEAPLGVLPWRLDSKYIIYIVGYICTSLSTKQHMQHIKTYLTHTSMSKG